MGVIYAKLGFGSRSAMRATPQRRSGVCRPSGPKRGLIRRWSTDNPYGFLWIGISALLLAAPAQADERSEPLQCPAGSVHSGGQPPENFSEGCVRSLKGTELRHGPWRFWHLNGVLSARGEYLQGLAAGRWTATWPDGTKQAEGDVLEGHPRGTWKIWSKAEWGQITIVEGSARSHFEAWYRDGRRLAKGDCAEGKAHPGWLGWERAAR
jgi:hypothetical protein